MKQDVPLYIGLRRWIRDWIERRSVHSLGLEQLDYTTLGTRPFRKGNFLVGVDMLYDMHRGAHRTAPAGE